MAAIHAAAKIGYTGGILAGMFCLLLTAYFMFRTVAHHKSDVNIWRDTGGNPFNLLLMPSKLTPVGLAYRKRCFLCLLGYLVCFAVAMLLGSLPGVPD